MGVIGCHNLWRRESNFVGGCGPDLMLLRRQREDPPGEGLSFNFNVMIIIILYN